MKPEDLMNVPEDKRDYSGCAHREPTKEEKEAWALGSVNAHPYVAPPKEEKKPTLFQKLKLFLYA